MRKRNQHSTPNFWYRGGKFWHGTLDYRLVNATISKKKNNCQCPSLKGCRDYLLEVIHLVQSIFLRLQIMRQMRCFVVKLDHRNFAINNHEQTNGITIAVSVLSNKETNGIKGVPMENWRAESPERPYKLRGVDN